MCVRQHWPHSVFENPETADRYDYFSQIPFGTIHEIFVYRDAAAADGWTRRRDPELYNTMVHIIADMEMVTVVVDKTDAEMRGMIDDISSALSDEILHVSAKLELEAT